MTTIGAVNCNLRVTLEIEGPFLCGSASPALWGFDAVFMRDYKGRLVIPKSHIKGKLREALLEAGVYKEGEIDNLFGKKSKGYELSSGRLDFSNFTQPDDSTSRLSSDIIHRIKVESKRGVVERNMLVMLENLFPAGSLYKWKGNIEYTAADKNEALGIENKLKIGLRWISAFGAEKGIGFGRLINVSIELEEKGIDVRDKPSGSNISVLGLYINALEPLLLMKETKNANYIESEDIIPGNMLKGALAEALNRRLNPEGQLTTPIDDGNNNVKKAFPLLTKHFSGIRLTHAYPSLDNKRPVVIPLTAVESEHGYHDITFTKPEQVKGSAPAFRGDWKGSGPAGFGWAEPLKFMHTRTAIDSETRRSYEGKLFTGQYVCPEDKQKNAITWISNLYIKGVSEDEKSGLIAELLTALSWLNRIGKERGRIDLTVKEGAAGMAQTADEIINDEGYAVVTLQSDTLMLNPEDMAGCTADKLKELYKNLWSGMSDLLEMDDFFAEQKLAGGTRVMRHKKGHVTAYYPFFLTSAGSVFRLKLKGDKEEAEKFLSQCIKKGVPLPAWFKEKHEADNRPLWQICPFIPQNGYGEAAVNLKWHSENKYEGGGE